MAGRVAARRAGSDPSSHSDAFDAGPAARGEAAALPAAGAGPPPPHQVAVTTGSTPSTASMRRRLPERLVALPPQGGGDNDSHSHGLIGNSGLGPSPAWDALAARPARQVRTVGALPADLQLPAYRGGAVRPALFVLQDVVDAALSCPSGHGDARVGRDNRRPTFR